MSIAYRSHERGVTSLIVVLFSTLLFVVVTVGFMQTMTTEQRASSDDELSRGAYDSALAGVEDGKRVLQACLINHDSASCNAIYTATPKCTTVSDAGFVTAQNGEVYIQSNSSNGLTGSDYEQAYTCVKITPDTKDYVGTVSDDASVVIPLRTTSKVNKLVVSWFMSTDSTNQTTVNLDDPIDTSVSLPAKSAWSSDTPPVLRLQLMQFADGNLDLDSFDNVGNGHTVYLYPKRVGALHAFSSDVRRSGSLSPEVVSCSPTFLVTYACQAEIDLPDPVGGSADNRIAYLRLSSMYNATSFSVAPMYDDASVKFNALQPSIDSTGRAADVFRRVDARVELSDPNDTMLYPRATVDTTNSFCKAFIITDSLDDYQDSCTN